LPQTAGIRHWLATGVSGYDWDEAATTLEKQYGVLLLPFKAEEVDSELPLWLDRLATQIRSAEATRTVDVATVSTKA